MKKVHIAQLFLFCLSVVLLISAEEINSIGDVFLLNVFDYLVVLIWTTVLFLLLLPLDALALRFIEGQKKLEPAAKKSKAAEYR